MNLSDIKRILMQESLQLTKSLGQNFLHDGNQLQRIVEAAELKEGERVLEIGPGLGPLTSLLVGAKAQVLAVEKDQRLAPVLKRRLGSEPGLELVIDDALDLLKRGNREKRDWSGWKMVSNLPYSVASPILVELASAEHGPDRIVATLQSEVAHRLMAGPGTKQYGVLSLLVQITYEPGALFKIPASCFFPEPDVESACVTLHRRMTPLVTRDEWRTFVKVVKRGFSQRRKMMVKLLKADWPLEAVEAGLESLGLDQRIRAEKLTLEQQVELTRFLRAAGR